MFRHYFPLETEGLKDPSSREQTQPDLEHSSLRRNTTALDYAGVSRPTYDLLDGFLDCVAPAPGEVAFIIGEGSDPTKPGLSAHSLIVNYFRAAIHMQACAPPGTLADVSNLIASCYGSEPPISCFYGHYSSGTGLLRYCNAGHHPPFLLRSQSGEIVRLSSGGPALGLHSAVRYRGGVERLDPGDRFLAYSRGTIEAWATPPDQQAEAILGRILRAWKEESATELASLIVDDAPESLLPSPLDRLALAGRIGRLRGALSRDIEEQAVVAAAFC